MPSSQRGITVHLTSVLNTKQIAQQETMGYEIACGLHGCCDHSSFQTVIQTACDPCALAHHCSCHGGPEIHAVSVDHDILAAQHHAMYCALNSLALDLAAADPLRGRAHCVHMQLYHEPVCLGFHACLQHSPCCYS